MKEHFELEELREDWQSTAAGTNASPGIAALRRQVRRETRNMRGSLVAPLVVSLVIGGRMLALAVRSGDYDHMIFAVETWLFVAVMWLGCAWIARGTWDLLGESTADFVALSLRRARSRIIGAVFGGIMYLAQLVFIVSWKTLYTPQALGDVATSWPVVALGWIGFPAYIAWSLWFTRAQRREIERLSVVQAALRD